MPRHKNVKLASDDKLPRGYKAEQDCSYQGEALKVPTAFYRLWSGNNINNIKN